MTVKMHQLRLASRDIEQPLSGANAIISIDGKPLSGVSRFTLSVGAGSIAKITIEMIANVEIDGLVDLKDDNE